MCLPSALCLDFQIWIHDGSSLRERVSEGQVEIGVSQKD